MLKNGGTHLCALKMPAMHQIINRLASPISFTFGETSRRQAADASIYDRVDLRMRLMG